MKKILSMFLAIACCLMFAACKEQGKLLDEEESEIIVSEAIENKDEASENKQTNSEGKEQNDIPNNSKPSNNSTTQKEPNANNTKSHVCIYEPATCTSPAKCSCGATVGDKLGHYYDNATCTEAKTCNRCGATEGSPIGHNYEGGKCKECGQNDPNYVVNTYSVGETWIVDGQWEFTITSVERHSHCNNHWDSTAGLTGGEDVVLIEYSYKNIGYTNSAVDLYIWSLNFSVYDEEGEAAEKYACVHEKSPQQCVVGTKSTASIAYSLKNPSSKIMLSIRNMSASNGTGKQTAKFDLVIS